ncbi:MAG: 3-hydroxyacyl-CoA dehydrogenase NAD-binding domain-containing protein, partial [Bacteroidota bacterium]
MKYVTVIGAGTMGNGIAHVFAQYGFDVTLNDIKQEFLDKGLAT